MWQLEMRVFLQVISAMLNKAPTCTIFIPAKLKKQYHSLTVKKTFPVSKV
jgi:hypothetical protein